MVPKKILLTEDEIPRQWYNINADIKMNPPLGPEGPVTPDMLAPVFPMNLIEQEVSAEGVAPGDTAEGIVDVGVHFFLFSATGKTDESHGQQAEQHDRNPATRGRNTEHEPTSQKVCSRPCRWDARQPKQFPVPRYQTAGITTENHAGH